MLGESLSLFLLLFFVHWRDLLSLSLWFTIGLVWFGELIISSVGEPEPREKKISGSGAGEKKNLAPRYCPSLWFFFDDMR